MTLNINANNTDGFGWKSGESAAFLSLKSALQAYFETYRATYVKLSENIDFSTIERKVKFESNLYKKLYFTTITQFQNFFELILKDCLERINPLLALKWDVKFTSVLYQNVVQRKRTINTNSISIEFDEALKRLIEVQKVNSRNCVVKSIDCILQNKDALETLNRLRNRIWHKGLFYLSYHNFDLFICEKILPLVKKIVNMNRYAKDSCWKYTPLNKSVNLIDSLIKESQSVNPNYEKIALLKEMGRAAYCNPLVISPKKKKRKKERFPGLSFAHIINADRIKYAKAKSQAVQQEFFFTDVFVCPVCGQETLIKHEISDWCEAVDENGNENMITCYIPEKIKCETCSFEVMPNIKDLSLCGITDPKFWDEHD